MLVRAFKPSDADALAALFHASVREVGIRDYSPEQVAAWSPSKPDPAKYRHQAEGRLCFVAENGAGEPIGYADLESDGHIDHLYCRPDVVGTGVGSALYTAIENAAKERGMAVLFVEASEAARRLFERRGFNVEARNDFQVNGVAIHNYRMSKSIRK
jgi:putative acetyltransferase